jgi:predicted  nucleic acid-binding Zn-ribbon protein
VTKVEVKPAAAKAPSKPRPAGKPSKSIEISASGEKKSAPSVTVSIFNPAPAKSGTVKKKPAGRKAAPKGAKAGSEKPPVITKPLRIERYQKPSSISISSSLPAAVTEADMKIIRDFIARAGYLDNQVAEVNAKLSRIVRVTDIFTEKVNSSQKDVGELKMKLASLKEVKIERDVSELKERTDEIESILEKISDKLRESNEEYEKAAASEAKKVKSINEDISGLKAGMKDMRERAASLNTELTKLGDFKAFVQDKAKEPQREAVPDAIKNMTDRFDSFDSRIARMTDKVMKLGRDMEKLTDYFMEGIKHMESRIMAMEKDRELSMTKLPENEFIPTTYRSHLKHETPETSISPVPEMPEAEAPDTEAETYDDSDLDEDYEMPRRRYIPIGPAVPMPLPPPAPLPPPGQPDSGKKQALSPPPAPMPERNMFTRLREGTIVRRPIQQIDPDMDVVLEHIRESIQKRESREKITRDLLNAGFDQDLISKAFMQARIG